MAINGNKEQVAHLVDCGVILPFCNLLNSKDSQAIQVVLSGIRNILNKAVNQDGADKIRTLIEECGGLDNIESLKNHENKEICKISCNIIQNYFSDDVVRMILQHFSNSELLKLSFVNKLWNYEARSVMRNRDNLIASLVFLGNRHCQAYLDAFASDLRRMNLVPFSGIRITLGHGRSACQTTALDSTYNTILQKLPLKIVFFDSLGDWSTNEHCPGSLLVRKALKHFSGVVQEVSLANSGSDEDDLILGFVNGCSFPSLRILKLGESYEDADTMCINSTLRALVNGAPKLQELHTQGPIGLMLTALEGTSVVLVLQSHVSAPFDEIPDQAIHAIRLERMQLHYTGPTFNVERFSRFAPLLLEASRSATLHSMEIDPFLAVPLMCLGVRLHNVTDLTLDLNPAQMEIDEPRILRILKDFDFTRIFPKLKKVMIFAPFNDLELSTDHMNGFVEQASASLKEPEPDLAVNIKELDVSTSISSAAQFFAQMFPHIKRIHVREADAIVDFGSIWKHWVNVKEVNVMADVQQNYQDLDSLICGIFPEEVVELRQKDDEFLKKVNIVPVMPAITCLRNLRKFFLLLAPLSDDDEIPGLAGTDYVGPPLSLGLSKVTGLVAFARFPNLDVTLSTYVAYVYQAIKHMKPYASVHTMLQAAVE